MGGGEHLTRGLNMRNLSIVMLLMAFTLGGADFAQADVVADGPQALAKKKKDGDEKKKKEGDADKKKAAAEKRFKKLDKDKNESLSKEEYVAAAKNDEAKEKMGKRFAKLDK